MSSLIKKSKINMTLEKFNIEGIQPLREIINKHSSDGKDVSILQTRLDIYTDLYNQVQRLVYSHSVFVYGINKFHNKMRNINFVTEDGKVDFDCLEEAVENNYKIILGLINFYKQHEQDFSTNNEVVEFMKRLQEECGGIRFTD